MQTEAEKPHSRIQSILKVLKVLLLLYLFLLSVDLLGGGFKLFGKGFATQLIETTRNPFIGLFIGILATSIVQSSSMTTSMVVGLVSVGTLNLEVAVPIIMGANIGTTVTNILVSMAHITRRDEFERALAAATVHDFFNCIAVIVLLPLELTTGYLRKTANWLAHGLFDPAGTGVKLFNPVKAAIKPSANLIKSLLEPMHHKAAGAILVALALILLFVSLYFLVRVMKSAAMDRIEVIFDRYMDKHGIAAMALGLVITATVQSSSVTTSLLVPMAAAGILTPQQIFPITLGANLGTTVTALLASLTGNINGLAIALVHVLFNLTGIILIYPLPVVRRTPVQLARLLASRAAKSRYYALGFVLIVFYLLPLLMIMIYRLAACRS